VEEMNLAATGNAFHMAYRPEVSFKATSLRHKEHHYM
jgi:hypothetical protein